MASRCGCRPASDMPTPSRCRALVHSQMSIVSRPAWGTMVLRGCVCGNRGCRTHNGYPSGSGRLGRVRVRFGGTSWCGKGTQVSLSTEPFADTPPFFFLYLDLSSIWCVIATWWIGTNVFALLCPNRDAFCTPFFFLSLYLSSIWCALATWWIGTNVFALLRSNRNAFLHPFFFRSLDLSSVRCALATWWVGTNVFALLRPNRNAVDTPFFSFIWTCRRSGVSSPHGGVAPMCLH